MRDRVVVPFVKMWSGFVDNVGLSVGVFGRFVPHPFPGGAEVEAECFCDDESHLLVEEFSWGGRSVGVSEEVPVLLALPTDTC